MNQPRPESRIRFLEKQFNTLGANVEELAEDLKQDIKQLNEGMMASFEKIGDTFIDTVANKEDLAALEGRITATLNEHSKRFDKLESTLQEILSRLPKQE